MLKIISDSFNNTLRLDPNCLMKEYSLSEGVYVLVDINTEKYQITHVTKKNNQDDNPIIHKIKERDIYSRYISSNKSFFDKKIHSVNYMSLSMSMENLRDIASAGKWSVDDAVEKILENFEVYKNPYLKYKDKIKNSMYQQVEEELGLINEDLWLFFKNWIEKNLKSIVSELKDKKVNNISIYLDCDIEEYRKEFKRYLMPNILTEPFKARDGQILGTHCFNTNLNSKKPFLVNPAKKNKFSSAVDMSTAVNYFYAGQLLNSYVNSGKNLVYIGETMLAFNQYHANFEKLKELKPDFFMEIRPEMGIAVVKDFDAFNRERIEEEIHIIFKDYLISENINIPEKSYLQKLNSKGQGKEILKRYELINLIDSMFFFGRLKTNLFKDKIDLGDGLDDKINKNNLNNLIWETRHIFKDYLYKNTDYILGENIERITMECLQINLNAFKASTNNKLLFSVRKSIVEHFEGESDMGKKIQEIDNKLKEVMLMDNISPEDNIGLEDIDEYSYLIGHLFYYLSSLSHAKFANLNMDGINNILRYNTPEMASRELNRMFERYNYSIQQNSNKFKNLFFLVKSFQQSDKKLNKDLIIAGYLSKNLMYRKSKKEM